MTLFTSCSIEIVNSQPNLTPEALQRFQIALETALEATCEEVLAEHGIAQEGMPTVILTDFYQAGDDEPPQTKAAS